MLRSWTQDPRNLRLLAHAFSNIKPLLAQVGNSGYVFTFRLPTPLARILGSLGDFFFMRLLNAFALGAKDPAAPVDTEQAYELLASSLGPGERQFDEDIDGVMYGESVRRRASTGGWMDKIGLYRDGCFSQNWEKPIELIVKLAELPPGRRGSLDLLRPEGAIRAPVTLIWGEDDVAIQNSLALDGFRDYFDRGSQLIKVKECGHWTPLEPNAIPIYEAILQWTLDGETIKLSQALETNYPMANIAIEK
jgi:pimeloyl-ACP methyl ester carboxylesterase